MRTSVRKPAARWRMCQRELSLLVTMILTAMDLSVLIKQVMKNTQVWVGS